VYRKCRPGPVEAALMEVEAEFESLNVLFRAANPF